MKKGLIYTCCLLLISWSWSCSTKKNTPISRAYHAFNSRYNIYYNGKTAFDKAMKEMQDGHQDRYSDMILMYPISAKSKDKQESGGPFDLTIEKCNKAIKLHSIQVKPPKKRGWRNDPKQRAFQQKEEYNPFLKKCWLLLGQAQFFNADFLEASATFSYISRHYATEPEVATLAKLWQARCYAEMNWFYEAEDLLNQLNREGIPQKNLDVYATVCADYLVKKKDFEEAVPYFKTAIKAEKNRHQRARMKYLLGQLYAVQDQPGLASQMFKDVVRSNPPYELEFAARIRLSEVQSGYDSEKTIRELKRMARSEKNKELLDQVYYALGNVYLSRSDTVAAMHQYHLAIEKSVRQGLERAICQLRLGDLYYQRREYLKAQPLFSSALSGIDEEYKDYKRVSTLSAVLDELEVHEASVHLQDSLQTLAAMSESERLEVIDKVIEQLRKETEEAKEAVEKEEYLEAQQAQVVGIDRPEMSSKPKSDFKEQRAADFYFYQPQLVSQGKAAFKRKWGTRVNEDNWRRRKKQTSMFEDKGLESSEEIAHQTAEKDKQTQTDETDSLSQVAVTDPFQRAFYLQQLPMSPEEVEVSDMIIIDGLYNMAMIYKEKLEDFDLAVDAFEKLNARFPANQYRLESYYQLYLIGLRYHDPALAARYKKKLMTDFPDSDYAVVLADPDYEYHIRTMDHVQDSIYAVTYDYYLANDTAGVRRNYEQISATYPLATLMPKFMFLNSLTYVQAGDVEGFTSGLKKLLDKYPKADVSELAAEMLKGVLSGQPLGKGNLKGMKWDLRYGESRERGHDVDSTLLFAADPDAPQALVLMYPEGTIDRNQLLFAVAAYNFAHFMVKQLDVDFEEDGGMTLLSVNGFYNLKEVVHYYRMIFEEEGYGKALDQNVIIFPISCDNYKLLKKQRNLEKYIRFFDESFGEFLPEVARRWKANDESVMNEQHIDAPKEEERSVDADKPLPAEERTSPIEDKDAVTSPRPAVDQPKKLTLDDIRKIRELESKEEESLREEKRKKFAVEQDEKKELQEKYAKDNADQIQQQKKEDEQLLKAKESREQQLEQLRKTKMKQHKAALKAKEKAYKEERKQKEKEYKQRLKAKEKERAEKEKEYKLKLKEKESAYKKSRKAKLKAMKKR